MSCLPCDKAYDENDVTFIRIDKANVGVVGCDEHVGKVFDLINWAHQEGIEIEPSGRPIVRIKKQS